MKGDMPYDPGAARIGKGSVTGSTTVTGGLDGSTPKTDWKFVIDWVLGTSQQRAMDVDEQADRTGLENSATFYDIPEEGRPTEVEATLAASMFLYGRGDGHHNFGSSVDYDVDTDVEADVQKFWFTSAPLQ